MNDTQHQHDIRCALSRFTAGNLAENTQDLLRVLGYRSGRTLKIEPNTAERFMEMFNNYGQLNPENALLRESDTVDFLFQITDDEIIKGIGQDTNFGTGELFDASIYQSYLFLAVKLRGKDYSRAALANITREVNKVFAMPALLIFQHGHSLTFAIIHRRPNRHERGRYVLEKVSLIKDIDVVSPHRAHVEILAELSVASLYREHKFSNFLELHQAWQKTLDISILNKRFYKEIADWYFWAVEQVRFPADAGEDITVRNATCVIRLITRLIFVWFLKERGLVSPALFKETEIAECLTSTEPGESTYYKAILQNLFFATLNQEMSTPDNPGSREFRSDEQPDNEVTSHYRYSRYFRDADEALRLFGQTPFLNGGLFESLDKPDPEDPKRVRYIDGFSDLDDNVLHVPNALFFTEAREVDLNTVYDTRNKRYTVQGLIQILNRYKFTVAENTPVEEEVALDPELLGRVFENLLAAYNPETGTTARKQTGSFYTPREIVNYMVDESLIAYFKRALPEDAETEAKLHQLFAYNREPHQFTGVETAKLINAIDTLKVLDPACGSGAFPMGILHKLVFLLGKLDPGNVQWWQRQIDRVNGTIKSAEKIDDSIIRESTIDELEREIDNINEAFERNELDYGRKLYLIENCIYGVDIQPIATQIAKLRFFISLIVNQRIDDTQENRGVRPLPNLETKFVTANTLLGVEKPAQMAIRNPEIDLKEEELAEVRRRHFTARTLHNKNRYRTRDAVLRHEIGALLKHDGFPSQTTEKIASWDPYNQNASADFFDSEWMFGIEQGFDLVIGNPPYAKSEHLSADLRQLLKRQYEQGSDLYDYFIFAGFKLVAEKGIFAYIANDSYVALPKKRPIRDLFLGNRLLHLVRAPAQTFEAAIYTAIFVLAKDEVSGSHIYMSGEINFPDFHYQENGVVEYATIHQMPDQKLLLSNKNTWVLRLLGFDNIEKFCRVLDTGIHSGNVRRKLFFKEDNGHRHRLLQGRQIQRFSVQWDSPKAKYRFCDIDYEPLPIPGIGRGGKPSRRDEHWGFGGAIENHHQPERLLMRQTDDDLIVAYHSEAELGRFYTDNTLHTILPKSPSVNLKYFLALFNSRLLNFVYHFVSQEAGKSQAQVKIAVVRKLPVVVPAEAAQRPIVALVDKILSAKGEDTAEFEREIDRHVYALYGLSEEEIRVVEEAE